MPTYLEEFGYFADAIVDPERPAGAARPAHAEDVADEWAKYLTDAQQK